MKHCYPVLLILFTVTACAPIPTILRVDPAPSAEVAEYRYGNPVLAEDFARIRVEANFYDASGDYLIFDVQVVNDGPEPILFEPSESAIIAEQASFSPALDPEFELLALDRAGLQQARAQRTVNIIGGIALVGTVAYALADGAGGGNNQNDNTLLAANVVGSVADISTFVLLNANGGDPRTGYQIGSPEVPSPYSRYFWLDHSFRKTTIKPGQRAYGKLVFLRQDEARSLQLIVSAAGHDYHFDFDQTSLRR